jgi:hypothetical protein
LEDLVLSLGVTALEGDLLPVDVAESLDTVAARPLSLVEPLAG